MLGDSPQTWKKTTGDIDERETPFTIIAGAISTIIILGYLLLCFISDIVIPFLKWLGI